MFESTAAKILAVIEVLALILMLIGVSVKISVALGFILFIISLPLALLYVYDVNCTFTGQCDVWGWIKTILASLYYVFVIIAIIVLMSVKQQKN